MMSHHAHWMEKEEERDGWMNKRKVEGRRVILVTFQAGVVTSWLDDCWHRHNTTPVTHSKMTC